MGPIKRIKHPIKIFGVHTIVICMKKVSKIFFLTLDHFFISFIVENISQTDKQILNCRMATVLTKVSPGK